MWRFISVTFAFLGYAFYTLSGGSDYAPRTQSIQARAKIDHVRPIPRPVRVNVIQLANSGLPKTGIQAKAITSLADLDLSNGNRFQITLATLNTDEITAPTPAPEPAAVQAVVLPETTQITDPAQNNTPAAAETPDPDIRLVKGDVVNMRNGPGTSFDQVARLTKGTEVAVLHDDGTGWIELRVVETGTTGWMADWLVTAAN